MSESNDNSDTPRPDQLPVPTGRGAHHLVPVAPAVTPASVLAELRRVEERDEDEIDLFEYWRVLVKRRWTVLSLLAAFLLVTLVGTLLTTPIYRASTTLQIERDTIKVVDIEGLTPGEATGDRDFYQTQYELLKSRTLAERVAAQLHLSANAAVARAREPSPWQKLKDGVRGLFLTPPPDAAAAVPDDRAFAGFVLGGLTVEPVRNSRLVRLNFDSPDGELSATIVNAVAEAFIATNLERRFDASSYAKGYLEERLQQLKLKLEDSERELVAFAQQEQIIDPDGNQSLVSQGLSNLSASVSSAQNERIKAEARWRQVQAAERTLPPDMLANSIIKTLQEKRAELMVSYQDQLRIYKPEFPAMKQLQGQIDEIDHQIAVEVANIKAMVKGEYDAAAARERMLKEQMSTLKSETLDLQNRSIRYNILRREVDTNRQLYDGLLQRYKEIGVAGGVSANNVSIVDRANPPGAPYKPRLTMNLAVGLLLGLFAGVLLALLLEHLDDTVKTPEDVEKRLRLVHLGVVPKLGKGETPEKALRDPRSAFAEAYRSVRTALQFSTETGIPATLVVTSTIPGEGKTTTALTLATNFAQLGKRVLLIDADLRNPSLHSATRIENSVGLSNCLSGAKRPAQCIHTKYAPNLSLLLSGPLPPNPAELLAGPRMVSLLTQALERYDQIIIDAPPVLGLADAPILSNMAKGTLLVVEAGRARIGAVQATVKRLAAARARLLGVVLTKFDSKVAGYGYGYGGYGYMSYDYHSYGAEAPKKLAGRR